MSKFARSQAAKCPKHAVRPKGVKRHARARAEKGKEARLAVGSKREHAAEQQRAEQPKGEVGGEGDERPRAQQLPQCRQRVVGASTSSPAASMARKTFHWPMVAKSMWLPPFPRVRLPTGQAAKRRPQGVPLPVPNMRRMACLPMGGAAWQVQKASR